MEFCIITPIAGLERYATLSKRHLVLAQVTDQRYMEFYRKRRQEGDTLILDNGAYEGTLADDRRILECIDYYTPQITVLPDKFLQSWEHTYNAARDFLNKHYQRYSWMKWMYVPQGPRNNVMNWIDGLINACDDLPIDWVGLPRCLATDISLDPLIRPQACELIRKRWPHIKVHALGMVKGNVAELPFLRDAGCESIDSSAPVWRGWYKGFRLTNELDMAAWEKVGTDCDFNAPLPLSISNPESIHRGARQIILENLEACGVNVLAARAAR